LAVSCPINNVVMRAWLMARGFQAEPAPPDASHMMMVWHPTREAMEG
jgi:hypothetical protein